MFLPLNEVYIKRLCTIKHYILSTLSVRTRSQMLSRMVRLAALKQGLKTHGLAGPTVRSGSATGLGKAYTPRGAFPKQVTDDMVFRKQITDDKAGYRAKR